MIYDDIWWYLMIYDDIWWYMMIYDDIWWYMMIYDDIWWYMMIYDDIWWYMMTYDDIWWHDIWYMIYDIWWWWWWWWWWHFYIYIYRYVWILGTQGHRNRDKGLRSDVCSFIYLVCFNHKPNSVTAQWSQVKSPNLRINFSPTCFDRFDGHIRICHPFLLNVYWFLLKSSKTALFSSIFGSFIHAWPLQRLNPCCVLLRCRGVTRSWRLWRGPLRCRAPSWGFWSFGPRCPWALDNCGDWGCGFLVTGVPTEFQMG